MNGTAKELRKKAERLNALLAAHDDHLRMLNDAERSVEVALHRNGLLNCGLRLSERGRDRIMFHVSRIIQEERVAVGINFEKKAEEI